MEAATAPPASPTATDASSIAADAAADRRRWLAFIVVCLGQLLMVLDSTIVNVALPSIQADLHFAQADLAWVIDAYLIAFGSLLLLAGRLGDLFGRKRVFLAGVALFTLASMFCGVAQSQGVLIAGRFMQGVGSAAASSAVLAIIVIEFPEPGERAKAMSLYTFLMVSGGSLGLVLGGLVTQTIDWHWIFFINLPVGIVALVFGTRLLHADARSETRQSVDWLGSLLVTVAMMIGVYAIVKSPEYGWGSGHTLGFGALSLVLLALFVAVEARIANPLIPLRIFRLRALIDSALVRVALVTGMFSAFFLRSLFFEHVDHYDALRTGVSFLPQTLAVAVLSLGVTVRLVARFGAKRVLLFGMGLMVAGLLILAALGPHVPYFPWSLVAFLLMGLGAGMSFMPLLTLALAEVPRADAGLGSAIVNVSMQIGGAVGVAALGSIATSHTRALSGSGHSAIDALAGGYQLAFLVAAGVCAVGGCYAARRL